MRAAQIVAPHQIEIIEEPIPEPEDGKILLRLERAAICGSDFSYFRDKHPDTAYPFPPGYSGHECVGVVEHSDSSSFRAGDFVLVLPPYMDGFKEYHSLTQDRLLRMPREKDTSTMLMTQLLGAVVHCCRRIVDVWGKEVVVIGQGPVGLLFDSMLKNMGATKIIGVDILDYRLRTAHEMGATHTVDASQVDVLEIVKDITQGRMADLVVEANGLEETINLSFELARHDGVVTFFGICLKESPALNFNKLFRKELRIIASVGPSVEIDYAYALKMVLDNQVKVEKLVSHVLPFSSIQEGFDLAINRKDEVIKVVLEF
ncbi:MAG: zinc-binding dehydrogenase [Thermodesulfobacteriota bacterium]|nr:zinc-binding dehydrogenase [Thermodesulfobacteriota bacterium]